ncbi:MAG: peptidase domain-containing ABC transporter [Magnetovibrionaceae bacterium]
MALSKRFVLREQASKRANTEWAHALLKKLGGGGQADPLAACLIMLLSALKWQGNPRHVVEALPYGNNALTPSDLFDVMARLGFRAERIRTHPASLHHRLYPCLVLKGGDKPYAILGETNEGKAIVYDGVAGQRSEMSPGNLQSGKVFVLRPIPKAQRVRKENGEEWFNGVLGRFRGLLVQVIGVSFVINLMALVVPLAIMAIYDQVVAKGSTETLIYLASGVLAAAVFEVIFRTMRARAQSFVAARLDFLVGSRVFEHILHLSPLFTERAPVGGQVTRIREFEAFRDFFTGALASMFLDLPFTLLFIVVIWLLAGPVAWIPMGLLFVYVIAAFILFPLLQKRTAEAGEARSERHAFLVELMYWMRQVKQQGAEDIWRERFRKISGDASWTNLAAARLNNLTELIAHGLMTFAGAATVVVGVFLAVDGSMSLGGLIATMMLVWRVLAPAKTLFTLGTRLQQFLQSIRQLKQLLSFDREQEPGDYPQNLIRFRGELAFNRVSLRYSADSNPALLGATFKVEPGELFGIAGHSGSGKTTIARIILGLYRPQGGTVTLDGLDIRQLKPITLRQTLAYVPQRNHAFAGSIFENIVVAEPSATFEQVQEAARLAGLLPTIEALPHGFDTVFREGLQAHVPQGFLRQISLARAFLRRSPILILDEPASGLDDREEAALMAAIEEQRGYRTIIMITQRPSHMRVCDRLLIMNGGQVELLGPPEEVMAESRRREMARKAAE